MSKPYSKAVMFEARALDQKESWCVSTKEAATNDLAIDAGFGNEFVIVARIKAVKLILNAPKRDSSAPRFLTSSSACDHRRRFFRRVRER